MLAVKWAGVLMDTWCFREEQDKQQAQYLDDLEKYETEHMGNYRRIYPNPGTDKYEKYFHSSGSLYQETAAFKARSEVARWAFCSIQIWSRRSKKQQAYNFGRVVCF